MKLIIDIPDTLYKAIQNCRHVDEQGESATENILIKAVEDGVEQKTGYWIRGQYTDTDIRYNDYSYCCSICDDISDFDTEYCPNCGAKMESEDEE